MPEVALSPLSSVIVKDHTLHATVPGSPAQASVFSAGTGPCNCVQTCRMARMTARRPLAAASLRSVEANVPAGGSSRR